MKILYLPIDINLSNMVIPEVDFKNSVDGKYQPYWNTFKITDENLKHIFDQLPFEKITNVYFKEQQSIVKPHVDVYPDMTFEVGEYKNILENEPAGYRIVLSGGTNKLFVKSGDEFKPAVLPTIPGCYLLNSTKGIHMVADDPGRKIIYIRGFLNPAQHTALIQKSLEKYKNLAILEDESS
jgi:hypothetical protein